MRNQTRDILMVLGRSTVRSTWHKLSGRILCAFAGSFARKETNVKVKLGNDVQILFHRRGRAMNK